MGPLSNWIRPRFSPDGQQVMFGKQAGDIWAAATDGSPRFRRSWRQSRWPYPNDGSEIRRTALRDLGQSQNLTFLGMPPHRLEADAADEPLPETTRVAAGRQLSRRLDQRFLFHPGQRLDGCFAFQCQTSTRENLFVHETDRKTTTGVPRGCPGIVPDKSTPHVSSYAGVQRVISTPKHVDKPRDL